MVRNVMNFSSLEDLLKKYTKDELKNIGKELEIANISQFNKTKLIEIIRKALSDEKKLNCLLKNMTSDELDSFKYLMFNEGMVTNKWLDCGNYLYNLGILYCNEKYDYIPSELYNILINIDLAEIENIVNENSKLYNLLKSMINLYGVINFDDLVGKYEQIYKEFPKISIEVFDTFLRSGFIDYVHMGDELYFVHNFFILYDAFDLVEEIVERQKWIPRKNIEISELLKYRNNTYYVENKEIIKFKSYLKSKIVFDTEDSLEEFVVYTIECLKFSNDNINEIVGLLLNKDKKLNIQKLFELLVDVYNNLIIYSNNGWTPIEMRNMKNG
ncbi:MAG: Rho termination factor N-terminal domain-containing protein [Candidatus Coprovivens sp.]